MWLGWAIGAAVLWGLVYVLMERLFHAVSVATVLLITSLLGAGVFLPFAWLHGDLARDVRTIWLTPVVLRTLLAYCAAWIAAEICISLSIAAKNASLAGLIEISYPIFIIFFSIVLFQENPLNLPVVIGGGLIFTGVAIIGVYQ
jgi:drug/metabolite transporter (DMT)-like permease